jgi:IclR family KDG regulon transcriptional repressor
MPRVSGQSEGSGVQAVVLALGMLEFMAQEQRAVGVTELARTFGTTKSRIHRHLQTLLEAGYILQEPETERYRVSARLMALGQAVSDGHELTTIARKAMRDLRDELGHFVALSVPERDGVRIISVLNGSSNLEIGVKPGSVLPYHSSAQGKVALAFGDETTLRRALNQPCERFTPYTLVDPLDLAANVRIVRERGWADAPNESLIGINVLAAPIFDALGNYVGALGLVDSVQFIQEKPDAKIVERICSAAQRISTDLGFRPQAGQPFRNG